MAERIMARDPKRASADATTNTPDASDLLENKLEQLNSLLWCFYGAGDGWFEDAGKRIGRICFGLLLIWRGRL